MCYRSTTCESTTHKSTETAEESATESMPEGRGTGGTPFKDVVKLPVKTLKRIRAVVS